MHTEPIIDKLTELMARYKDVKRLIEYGWKDKSIALYLGSDAITVRRFRKMIQAQNAKGDEARQVMSVATSIRSSIHAPIPIPVKKKHDQ